MTLIVLALMLAAAGQDPHQAMHDRGAKTMGFDQTKTAHHFYLYSDGGAIDVRVKNRADTKDLAAIRSHLPHLAVMFQDGNFEAPMLVHDTKTVPGVAILSARKETLRYTYAETPAGGRITVVTTDAAARAALHDFLKYQIREHQTGDPLTISKRQ
jgi:hypothetical protein